MFALPAITDTGIGAVGGELIGTFILVLLILVLVDQDRISWVPVGVGAWVAAMVLSTPSGGLLNPAVTIARTLTDTYTRVAVSTAAPFLVIQLVAAIGAVSAARILNHPPLPKGT